MSPAIGANGIIYAGSLDGSIFGVCANGVAHFHSLVPGVASSPAVAPDTTVYFGADDGQLRAINPDGVLKWAFAASAPIIAAPAVEPDGSAIYVADVDGHVYKVGSNGRPFPQFAFAGPNGGPVGPIQSSPALASQLRRLYFGSDDGHVYAIDADTGAVIWDVATGGRVRSSPAVATGGSPAVVVVGSRTEISTSSPTNLRLWRCPSQSARPCVPHLRSPRTGRCTSARMTGVCTLSGRAVRRRSPRRLQRYNRDNCTHRQHAGSSSMPQSSVSYPVHPQTIPAEGTSSPAAAFPLQAEELEAFQVLLSLAHRKTGDIPAALLVRHTLAITAEADWPVRRAAMEALLRRCKFAEQDGLEVASRPAGKTLYGLYRTKRASASERPYTTLLSSVDPLRASCDCADFVRNSLGICKHVLTVLEDVAPRSHGIERNIAAAAPRPARLTWHPVRPLTGRGDWLERVSLIAGDFDGERARPAAKLSEWFRSTGTGDLILRSAYSDSPTERLDVVNALLSLLRSDGRRRGLAGPVSWNRRCGCSSARSGKAWSESSRTAPLRPTLRAPCMP